MKQVWVDFNSHQDGLHAVPSSRFDGGVALDEIVLVEDMDEADLVARARVAGFTDDGRRVLLEVDHASFADNVVGVTQGGTFLRSLSGEATSRATYMQYARLVRVAATMALVASVGPATAIRVAPEPIVRAADASFLVTV